MKPKSLFTFQFFILALAAFLRLYNLNWKSADNDEAWSWYLASRPLPQLLNESLSARGDPHPPVYWLTLKAWMALGGTSELSMRLLSVGLGLLFVALTYALGRRLLSRPAALAAMLFTALNAFLIWNSQDARMYTMGGTLSLAGLFCLTSALRSGRWRDWLAYAFLTTLACYTHLAASFLLPFEGLFILLALWKNPRADWRRAFTALGLIALSFLPFALNVWRASGPGHNVLRQSLGPVALTHNILLQLTTYEASLTPLAQWLVALFIAALFILGLLPRQRPLTRPFITLYFSFFIFIILLLSLREPVYQPKSLTFIGAALALGVGAGWARLYHWRKLPAALLGLGLVGLQLMGLASVWSPGTFREDWRSGVGYLNRHVEPGAAILAHLEYYQVVLRYYFRGPQPIFAPFGSHLPAELDSALNTYQTYDTLWLAQSGTYITDPDHRVQTWLETRYPEITEIYPSGILIKGFAPRFRFASLPASAIPSGLRYPALNLALAGYAVPERELPTRDVYLHPPSNWVHTTLYWQADQPLLQDIRLTLTLEDDSGNVWGSDLPRATDLRAFHPPLKWQPGEIVRWDFDVNLNPDVPPGSYKLVLRVYPTSTDAPLLNTTGEDWFILAPITLVPNN